MTTPLTLRIVLVNVVHLPTGLGAQVRFDLPAEPAPPGLCEFVVTSILTVRGGDPYGASTPAEAANADSEADAHSRE